MSDPFDPQLLSDDDGFDDLAALRTIGRDLSADDLGWDAPPDDLWARIEAEAFGVAAAPVIEPPATGPPVAEPPVVGVGGGSADDTTVVPFPGPDQRKRRWLVPVAAVAAAALIVVGIITVNATRPGDEPELIASVTLDVLGDAGSGRAELVNADGVKQIRLETADLDAGDGFLEVWVIDPSVTKLVSLGPLRPDGIYDLPEGLDPAQFPIVDISVEPVDGDPTHSGNSVLRGQLTV
ncbi:MAG TPA: anti-sigma factor [Acidimicrobiales bacterium]|nr:anti-sigma factor [Acidimicrobiales bacterium]